MRTSLNNVTVDRSITGRWYQESAIKAVCNSFEENRRNDLLKKVQGLAGVTNILLSRHKLR